MTDLSRYKRQKIVKEEMQDLLKAGFIDQKEYERFLDSYNQYIKHDEEKRQTIHTGELHTVSIPKEKKPKETKTKVKKIKEQSPAPVAASQPKVKTAEQIRERNITWLLVLGVTFLLISGLVVATSTWEQMGALLKVITLLGVSVFFLILSAVSSSILKINKTAFAFLTLGSLLLPIAVIAIGYFGLLGDYLTLTGEGRFVLGMICTILPLPLYARNAVKNQSKLFVWIFYLFLTFFIGFSIAATKVPVDVYYFLIMLYNGLLLLGYHRLQNYQKIRIFIKELPGYAQLNLVISTILMLFVFDQKLFYSFNILLTAFLYISMIFIYNTKKGYHFMFTVLFAYGIYQLTENSWLHSIDLFVYSLIGAGYLGFAYLIKRDDYLVRVFHYTSAFMSVAAFIYISFQGIILRAQEDSWVLLLAYFTIVLTYIYLANITKNRIFPWLASVFLIVSGFQIWELVFEPVNLSFPLFMFLYASLLFTGIGLRTNVKYLNPINRSTYYISIIAMIFSIFIGLLAESYIQVCFMFVLFGCLALLEFFSQGEQFKKTAAWTNAVSWWFALYMLYPAIIEQSFLYQIYFDAPFHLAVAGIIMLAISLVWKKTARKMLENASFYIGQISYLLALFSLMDIYSIDTVFVRPAILFVGIGAAVWLVRHTGITYLWSIVSVMTLAFYMSLISTLSLDGFVSIAWFMQTAPVLLLVIERFAGKYAESIKPHFFWLSIIVQSFLILLILLDQLMVQLLNPIIILIPLAVYLYSTFGKKLEWQVKILLYAAMTMIPILLSGYAIYYDDLLDIGFGYRLIISSVFFAIIWKFVPLLVWKKRMEWYMIPFSLTSLVTVIAIEPINTLLELVIVICFLILNLYFLHVRKWLTVVLFPLLLTILLWEQQEVVYTDINLFFISIVCFFILLIAGKLLYRQFYQKVSDHWLVDWYSAVAFVYAAYLLKYSTGFPSVWIQIIPYLLLAVWLFLHIKRIDHSFLKKVFVTLGAISLLPAYYHVLFEYKSHIPELFEAEFIVMPIIILSILLSRRTWREYQRIMANVQTVILVFITVYLIADAIQSNTVWDALIVGTLSIVSLLAGMKFQIRSYLFIGLGTLLFNVIYQTKPYWGNMPWWGYLLIAGLTLIIIASYNEWKKQRKADNKLAKKIKNMLAQLKEWE
ncbi:hypothetical protein F9U64_00890 [Gracilibacillus oryzae]|uniref:DUF2157 domain-containing protein n=1 Tax=Gracilibacillus oryzae TaxID=1672701 RepID=A0A7C8GVR9_9BACI|nr:hypothetical protein [Gracilibacillus oryzae]KAB8139382.1 hypothetical protein F9U64_00890 [Gracilibacillus oryzae]